jgi:hypothetical protein
MMDPEIRKRWRQELVNNDDWQQYIDQAVPIAAGMTEGGFVRSQQTRIIGYMKPMKRFYPQASHQKIAVYEKIASDLAYEVGLNIPPVILHQRPDPPPTEPKEVVISLASVRSSPWGEIFNLGALDGGLSGDQLEGARRVLAESSGVLAFDSWLQDQDRRNSRNAVLAYDCGPEPGTMLYLDHSKSMDYGRQWTRNHQVFEPVPNYPFFEACIDRERVRAVAQKIAALPDDVVAEIVRRIPAAFLPAEDLESLATCLIWRKQNLLPNWGQWYAGP